MRRKALNETNSPAPLASLAAIVTVATFAVAACSSGGSSSSSLARIRLGQLEHRADRFRARHHPDHDHHRQPPAAHRSRRARLQRDRARVGRVLRLRQRARRGVRPQDRLQVPRRRLQPDQDGVGGAPAGAAGPACTRIFDGLGTPTHLAALSFLNAQKVPDVFVASGCDCWNDPSKDPETFGWQLDYIREGKILGQYVKQHFAGKKVGFFYQNDEFGQDGVKGLLDELPASMVVSKQTYDPTNTNIASAVAALRASGAQVVVSFSIPAFTALLKLEHASSLASTRRWWSAASDPTRSRCPGCSSRSPSRAARRSTATSSSTGSSATATCPTLGDTEQQLDRAVQEGPRPVRREGAVRRQRAVRRGRRVHLRAGDAQGGPQPDQGRPGLGDRGAGSPGTRGGTVLLTPRATTWASPALTWALSPMASWCSKGRS